MKVYISKSIDPFYNIALEDWLLQEVLRDDCILYLWRNSTSIIIGRSQNPWIECSKEVFFVFNVFMHIYTCDTTRTF